MNERLWGLGTAVGAAAVGALVAISAMLWLRPPAQPTADVRGYLLSHPEVISEAMDRLQQKETGSTVAANRDAIVAAFPGAVAGNPRGDVTLTEYYDYACGYCRQTVSDIDRLVQDDPRLRVVFKELPILSPLSDQAARLSLAAAKAGRFAAFHHTLFDAGQLTSETMGAAAHAAGVDAVQADTPDIAREVETTMETARALKLNGTPSFVIGDQLLAGAVGYDQLKAAVDQARATRS
jgi:protein-disulfide isomerase